MKRSDILMAATAIIVGFAAVAAPAAQRGDAERPGFAELDNDGDGSITAADLDAMRDARFAELDADGNGEVTLEEFLAASRANSDERATHMFERLDADGDGVLGRDVLESRDRGPNAERMIERLDADGDGAVSEEEFEAARERMADFRGKRGGHGGGPRSE